jgi:recombination protein RecT
MSNELTVSVITSSLMADLVSNGISDLLPKGLSIETFAKLAAVAIFNNPMLREAEPKSVINSLIMSAKDGLLCDGREAALVPFKNKGVTMAQYMPMVDGILKRVRQSGQVSVIASKPVFANDEFTFFSDEDGDHFKHVPTLGDPGGLVAVIAYAKMKDGTRHIELLRRWEIDRARTASKTGGSEYGPWAKYYDRMACKTGLHRIGRRLPNSSEILEMLERGDPKEWQREERDVTPQREESAIDAIMAKAEQAPQQFIELDEERFNILHDAISNATNMEDFGEAMANVQASRVNDNQKAALRKAATVKKKELTSPKPQSFDNFD